MVIKLQLQCLVLIYPLIAIHTKIMLRFMDSYNHHMDTILILHTVTIDTILLLLMVIVTSVHLITTTRTNLPRLVYALHHPNCHPVTPSTWIHTLPFPNS